MTVVPLLTIELVGTTAKVRLEGGRAALAEPVLEEVTYALDAGTVAALAGAASRAMQLPPSPYLLNEVREAGALLYRTFIPEALRPQLQALVGGPLLLSTSLHGIPWELLHDGDDFWGLHYAMGKRLILSRAPRVTPMARRTGGRARALLIASDPRGDLPTVTREIEVLCDRLSPRMDLACLAGPLATIDAVLRHIGEGFDVIHYCGHVEGENDDPAFLLADQSRLPASLIASNLRGRPVVFVNGCASTAVSGLAQGFLLGGAQATIGPSCDVPDSFAADMAAAFYRQLIEGLPVGESLRLARRAMSADPTLGHPATWLSFTLLGNPMLPIGEPSIDGRSAVVPTTPPPVRSGRRSLPRRSVLGLMVAAIAALATWGSLVGRGRLAPTTTPHHVAVGVMTVEARDGPVPEWMQNVTRDSLNTILSKFDGVQVFARQKIDFLREKRGLTEIEAAETLGMTKMLSARVVARNAQVNLVVEIVDINSGVLDAVEEVQGGEEHLIELLNQLATKTLQALGVNPTQEQLRKALATRTNETLDGYRMLSDTLGGGTTPAPPSEKHTGRTSSSWLSWPRAAYAQAPERDENAIQQLLYEYERALEAKDVEAVAGLQVEMPEAQRASLSRYLGTARELEITISGLDVLVEGNEALATFTRVDAFRDARSSRPMHLEVRINATLRKTPAGWRIESLRGPS